MPATALVPSTNRIVRHMAAGLAKGESRSHSPVTYRGHPVGATPATLLPKPRTAPVHATTRWSSSKMTMPNATSRSDPGTRPTATRLAPPQGSDVSGNSSQSQWVSRRRALGLRVPRGHSQPHEGRTAEADVCLPVTLRPRSPSTDRVHVRGVFALGSRCRSGVVVGAVQGCGGRSRRVGRSATVRRYRLVHPWPLQRVR